MGWASAVGVMQQVSERLMHIGGLPEERQVVRGRSLPTWMNDVCAAASKQRAAWWHIYLDNFCSAERVVLGEAGDESQALHQAAEASWEAHGVLSAPDKRVCGAHEAKELGAYFSGKQKWMGADMERLLKTCKLSLFLSLRPHVKPKELQILLGRWVFVLQFRRAAMSHFRFSWDFINGKGSAAHLLPLVRRELL
ncbi:unnamed protein product, partial [Effrenium voratum]